ncbi:PREDICTED: 63 kDa sperm flagellar membrane protein-like [Priapulus caudatus]|uniref:63 kDa sperm flagellar membrane protein-like n=1 Tax=Priapulus caudatus TaxID=37621 RepID=A0ABM1F984_PRICU|nr:PREDICTED: 63 kDa sperm flagellar membrane protein-like [Priapulus caudatus]
MVGTTTTRNVVSTTSGRGLVEKVALDIGRNRPVSSSPHLEEDSTAPSGLPIEPSGTEAAGSYREKAGAGESLRPSSVERMCSRGDVSNCRVWNSEWCSTGASVQGVCVCMPGYARKATTSECLESRSYTLLIRLYRYDGKLLRFTRVYEDTNSAEYIKMKILSENAISSAYGLRDAVAQHFLGAVVVGFLPGSLIVNTTVSVASRSRVKASDLVTELQRSLLATNNRVGSSKLFVASPVDAVARIEDYDECADSSQNDCSKNAYCLNEDGSFTCACARDHVDESPAPANRPGRICVPSGELQCPAANCNNNGRCRLNNGVEDCVCEDWYIGGNCQLNVRVILICGGATIAALTVLTLLVCGFCCYRRQ